jgi:hypothetical protein
MRIRSIKPEFFRHRMHKIISEPAALLAVALICYPDDDGRFEADPVQMATELFPRRPLSIPILRALEELVNVGFVRLYQADLDGQKIDLGLVVNFRNHQTINKYTPSRLPAPPKVTVSKPEKEPTTVALPEDYGSTPVALPPSRIRSRPAEGRKEGEERKERKEGAARHSNGVLEVWEDEVQDFALAKEIPPACARKFWLDMTACGWKDGRLRPIENWRAALQSYAEGWDTLAKKNPPPTENGDDPLWWVAPLNQLEEQSLSLASTGLTDQMADAQRIQQIIETRKQRT